MDPSLFRSVNRFAARSGWLHGPARFYAKDGDVVFAILLFITWLLARLDHNVDGQAKAIWAGAAAAIALGIGQIIGNIIDRHRPYEAMHHVHVLVNRTTDFSFPSDHATAAGAAAVGLYLANRKIGIATIVLAVLMAATRVYVGAHYPGDVLAGLILGGTVAALGARPGTTAAAWLVRLVAKLPGGHALTGIDPAAEPEPA